MNIKRASFNLSIGAGLDVQSRKHRREKVLKGQIRIHANYLAATRSGDAPWYVIPADEKQSARLIVHQLVVDALERGREIHRTEGRCKLQAANCRNDACKQHAAH